MLTGLADRAEMREQELDLQVAIGHASIALRGFGAPQVAASFKRAYELCLALGHREKLLAVLHGLWVNEITKGNLRSAGRLAAEMVQLGEACNDDVALVTGYRASGSVWLWYGEFAAANEHLERGLALYQPERRSAFAGVTIRAGSTAAASS